MMSAAVISPASLTTFCPDHDCWNVWPLQTADQLMQLADPSVIFLNTLCGGHGYTSNACTGYSQAKKRIVQTQKSVNEMKSLY